MYKSKTKWTFPKSVGRANKYNIMDGDLLKCVIDKQLYFYIVEKKNENILDLIELKHYFKDDYIHFDEIATCTKDLNSNVFFKCLL